MHNVFLGIGGNIGNKSKNFKDVITIIKKDLGEVVLSSSVYETQPWGFEAEENFWNQVLLIETSFSPENLLQKIAEIEKKYDRTRENGKYSSRQMDIDILYFDDFFINTENLVIPHPHIPERLFVLVPLVEIAPDFVHPVLKLSNNQLLEKCDNKLDIKKIKY